MTKKTAPAGPQVPGAGDAERLSEAHIEVASTVGASAKDVAKLMEEIRGLKEKLKLSEQQRSDAEAAALAAAEAQGMLMQRQIQEVATGKTVKVKRASGYEVVGHKDDGREILKPVWKTVELPTYFYKIDMPAVGGWDLKINGQSLFHGTVYEFDIDTLRSVKEIVYRTWDHERSIHGSDENAYRPQQQPTLTQGRAH